MANRTTLRLLLAFCLITWAGIARPGAAEPGKDGAFTTVTTHIEADEWHVLRYHHNEPLPPLPPLPKVAAAPGDDKASSLDVNLAGLFIYKQYVDAQHRVRARHEGLLQVPFIFDFDDYLVALYDGKDHYGYDQKNAWGGNLTHSRLALLDAPIVFTAFESRFDAPDGFYWEALDLPLSTTISHRVAGKSQTWTVLDVPLACGFSYHGDGNSAHATLLDIPLASLYDGESHRSAGGKIDSHWTVLDVPFFTLMENDNHGDKASFTFADGPLFYLWRQKQGPGGDEIDVLRLPLLGPVFSWKSGKDGSKVGVLPDIF